MLKFLPTAESEQCAAVICCPVLDKMSEDCFPFGSLVLVLTDCFYVTNIYFVSVCVKVLQIRKVISSLDYRYILIFT